eukprot:COSAG02_NODE_2296_length_9197_cov_11.568587_6_plen_64_part_00
MLWAEWGKTRDVPGVNPYVEAVEGRGNRQQSSAITHLDDFAQSAANDTLWRGWSSRTQRLTNL